MMTRLYKIYILICLMGIGVAAEAGNPDRQGEAGASELLMNPWAGSSGFHTMNTACISGVEAMRLNPAGLSRIEKGEFIIANSQLYVGADLSMNAGGFATKVGKNGTIGISLVSLDFGDIPITTENQPEGTGGTFSPSFFHIGLGYSYLYDNRISVGVLVRGISESLPSVSAFGLAIDAGVQYVSGPKDNFKLGISLRNTGAPLEFSGQGLSYIGTSEDGSYNLTLTQRAEDFDLPSVLNLGISYDFYLGDRDYLRALANFTSNAFSRDQIGAGLEFNFRDIFQVRGAYRYNIGSAGSIVTEDIYTGLAAGFSAALPVSKKKTNQKLALDYAYRTTSPFRGTHNIGLRFMY